MIPTDLITNRWFFVFRSLLLCSVDDPPREGIPISLCCRSWRRWISLTFLYRLVISQSLVLQFPDDKFGKWYYQEKSRISSFNSYPQPSNINLCFSGLTIQTITGVKVLFLRLWSWYPGKFTPTLNKRSYCVWSESSAVRPLSLQASTINITVLVIGKVRYLDIVALGWWGMKIH